MPKYKVVVKGRAPGVSRDEVLEKLAAAFKLPPEKAAALADAQGRVVRKDLDLQTAARYEAALGAAGCSVVVSPQEDVPVSAEGAGASQDPPERLAPIAAPAPASQAVSASARPGQRSRSGTASAPDWNSIAGTVLSLAMLAYGLYFTLDSVRPGWWKKAVSATRGPNQLESVLLLGKSRASEFEQFRMRGGLEAESRWKGFKVQALAVQHRASGELAVADLHVYRKYPGHALGSLENFKAALRSECGTAWDVNETQTRMSAIGPDGVACVVNGTGEPVQVMLVLTQRRV
jgi:hypothetical protein